MSDPVEVGQFKDIIYANFAVTVVAAYDILLTFPLEVHLVWARPWHWVNFLFLANRYFAPIQSALSLVSWLAPPGPGLPLGSLNNLNLFAGVWVTPAVGIIIEALQVLRVYVLYHEHRLIRLLLCFCFLAYVGGTFGMAVILNNNLWTIPSPYPNIIGSDIDGEKIAFQLWPMTWIPGTVLEFILVVLIIFKTYSHVKLSPIGTPILALILRDGCLYFVAIFLLNLANVLCYTLRNGLTSLFEIPALALSAVLCSRLFLNLRGQLYENRIEYTTQNTMHDTHELTDFSTGTSATGKTPVSQRRSNGR